MLAIEMLPALYGDCLWIEYGDPAQPHRILVDCGLKAGYRAVAERLRERPDVRFELFVMTHIDADHIAGGIPLLQEFGPERFDDIWFNGLKHLPLEADILGVMQAEIFSALLSSRGFPWNQAWEEKTVAVLEKTSLPEIQLPGGMKLTLLSPTLECLADLRTVWDDEVKRLGLIPGSEDNLALLAGRSYLQPDARKPFTRNDDIDLQPDALGPSRLDIDVLAETPYKPDSSTINGSSIALLAEYEGKSVLLSGDAFAPILETTITRLLQQRNHEHLRLDALKVSHHGGRGNTSPGLLGLVRSEHFLLSTNGSCYRHPHQETIARILKSQRDVRLHFNYRSDESEVWDDPDLQNEWRYEARYPRSGANGYKLLL